MGDMSPALEYERQAKQFLEKAWQYLAADDLPSGLRKRLGCCFTYGRGRRRMMWNTYTMRNSETCFEEPNR